ncbi:MAG: two-component sensor histidine kinase, partial [Brevibacterium sp.]|nr:two-component sensor histidine kinase [Brevibacterium sp.]
MTPHPGRRTLMHALLWTGISLAIGALLVVIGISAEWHDLEDAGDRAGALGAELLLHIIFGIIALACLPVVLCFDGRRIPRRSLRPKVLA